MFPGTSSTGFCEYKQLPFFPLSWIVEVFIEVFSENNTILPQAIQLKRTS